MSDDVTINGKEIASLVAFAGIASSAASKFIDGAPEWLGLAGAVALFAAAAIWVLSKDDEDDAQPAAGEQPSFQQAPMAGFLVGSRIRVDGHDFTILDDTAPSMAAAVRNGGRGVVTAVDSSDKVGLLFLGFDAAGNVVEASTNDSGWHRADLVS